jgi:polysaccharide deacetylase family protein (PEP-CTERM system associated)
MGSEKAMGPNLFSNIMTIDVEDWFHILEAGEGNLARRSWSDLESRVEANTDRLLEILASAEVQATFFVIGWVARRFGPLIRRIADAGHEVASHSYWHEVLGRHTRDSLATDLAYSKRLLEDLCGCAVPGFRAPGASITPSLAWVFDAIVEQGYDYDASLCPGFSSHGGYESPFFGPHRVRCEAGELLEIPSSTRAFLGRRFPYAGGGYLRLFPYWFLSSCIRHDNAAAIPTNIYIHPREIDPDQPRMDLPMLRRFKYYVGLRGAEAKLVVLLRDFHFVSCSQWIATEAETVRDKVLDVRAQAACAGPLPDPAQIPPDPQSDIVPLTA